MIPALLPVLKSLHSTYCAMTGHEPPYNLSERRWFEFNKAGLTEADLKLVLDHILYSNRKRDYKYSLRFDKIIGDLERFSDLLGEARASQRGRKTVQETAKEEVVKEFRRADNPIDTGTFQSAREVLKRAIEGIG
jgi:hypothetical protein